MLKNFSIGNASSNASGRQQRKQAGTQNDDKQPVIKMTIKLGKDGFALNNRPGAGLCGGFQEGKCIALGRNGKCLADGVPAHQCN